MMTSNIEIQNTTKKQEHSLTPAKNNTWNAPPNLFSAHPGTSAEISGFDSRKAEAKALVARARKMGEMMFDTWHFWATFMAFLLYKKSEDIQTLRVGASKYIILKIVGVFSKTPKHHYCRCSLQTTWSGTLN